MLQRTAPIPSCSNEVMSARSELSALRWLLDQRVAVTLAELRRVNRRQNAELLHDARLHFLAELIFRLQRGDLFGGAFATGK